MVMAIAITGKHQCFKWDKGDILKCIFDSGNELTAIFNQPDLEVTLSSAGCEMVWSIMGQSVRLAGGREHIIRSQPEQHSMAEQANATQFENVLKNLFF